MSCRVPCRGVLKRYPLGVSVGVSCSSVLQGCLIGVFCRVPCRVSVGVSCMGVLKGCPLVVSYGGVL